MTELMRGVYEEGRVDEVKDMAGRLKDDIEMLDWYFNADDGVGADKSVANAWYRIREEIRRYEED